MSAVSEALKLARERMADPDKVVLNPRDLYEEADGTRTLAVDAVRACIIGHVLRAARETGVSSFAAMAPVRDAAYKLACGTGLADPLTVALEAGKHLEVLDAAIESSKLEESPGDTSYEVRS